MGSMEYTKRTENGYTIKNWQYFLEQHYHILSLNLDPIYFFTWLRSKDVLTATDQELILNSQYTTVARMGKLVDIVKTKGENGFKAFMEVVEFSYPEVFCSVTGQQPRDTPPSGYLPDHRRSILKPSRQRPQSTELLGMMGDLVQTLFSGLTCKKDELSKLKNYCSEMQENICREKADLYLQMKCSNEVIQFLEKEKEELSSKLEQCMKERQEMSVELENLRSIKDKYMEESSRFGKERDELSLEVQRLQDELAIYNNPRSVRLYRSHEGQQCLSLPTYTTSEEISVLSNKLSTAQKEILASSFAMAQLESTVKELKCQKQTIIQDATAQAERFQEVLNERNKVIEQKRALEKELHNERVLRNKVSEELLSHKDKHRYMESELKKLQDELENLKSQEDAAAAAIHAVTSQEETVPQQESHLLNSEISAVCSESLIDKPMSEVTTSRVPLRTSPDSKPPHRIHRPVPLQPTVEISLMDPIAPPRRPSSLSNEKSSTNRQETVEAITPTSPTTNSPLSPTSPPNELSAAPKSNTPPELTKSRAQNRARKIKYIDKDKRSSE